MNSSAQEQIRVNNIRRTLLNELSSYPNYKLEVVQELNYLKDLDFIPKDDKVNHYVIKPEVFNKGLSKHQALMLHLIDAEISLKMAYKREAKEAADKEKEKVLD